MDAIDIMTPETITEVRNYFTDFDDDGDGEIEVQCVESALRSYGLNPTAEQMQDILSDVSRSNTVNFNTFCYIVYRLSRLYTVEENLINAFKLLDKDCTGKVGVDVFEKSLTCGRHPLSDEQKKEVLSKLPVDNGFVDYVQGVKILTSLK